MTQILTQKPKEHFLADWAALAPRGVDAIDALRKRGIDEFRRTEYPHTRMEEWRHTNINDIVDTPYKSLVAPTAHAMQRADLAKHSFDAQWPEAVIVDGFFAPELSSLAMLPADVIITGLAEAARGPHAALVKKHLGVSLQSRSAYTALNNAFVQDGVLVYVPKDTVLETPIHLCFLSSARETRSVAHSRVLAVIEQGAEAAIVESHLGLGGGVDCLTNFAEEITLGANASLNYYKIVQEGPAANHLATAEFRLDRDSRLKSHVITLDGRVVRNQVVTHLAGEGANVSLAGLYLNDGDRLIDNPLSIVHLVPHCMSRILYKGILDGHSKSVFSGHVYVKPDAQKTDSNQLSNNLLLSGSATIMAKPQLEIFADDVKCTHGATVGSFPPEVVFYFRSRGIDAATARGMLTYGFADEVVEEIDLAPVRRRLNDYIYKKYSPKQ